MFMTTKTTRRVTHDESMTSHCQCIAVGVIAFIAILFAHPAFASNTTYSYTNAYAAGNASETGYPTAASACAASNFAYVYPGGDGTAYENYTVGSLLSGSPA